MSILKNFTFAAALLAVGSQAVAVDVEASTEFGYDAETKTSIVPNFDYAVSNFSSKKPVFN